jgi:large subunit ribosomal protein L29
VKATETLKEIRGLSTEELKAREQQLRVDLFKARIQNHTNQLDSTAKLRTIRRDIARIATVLRQRELEAEGAQS